jgi:uncharacterized protein (DUF885 family)
MTHFLRIRIAIVSLLTFLFALTPTASGAAARGDAVLGTLAQRHYRAEWQFFPTDATDAGIHDYDNRLGSYAPPDFNREIARKRETLAALDRIPSDSLSLDSQIDKQILTNSIKRDLFYLSDFPEWRLRPGYYNDIAANGIYTLISRDFAPASQRLRFVIARERQIPAMLAQAKRNLNIPRIAPIVARYAAEDTDGSADFLAHDVPLAFSNVHDPTLLAQFQTSNAAALSALKDYARYIRVSVLQKARGGFALGLSNFQYLANLDNAQAIPVARLLAVGEAALAHDKATFIATAKKIDPNHNPQQVFATLKNDHPTADTLLPTAQQQLIGLVAFIKAHHIISLPQAPVAKVVPTPPFAASTTSAAFDGPGPLERVAKEPHYYVTPVPAHLTKQQVDEYLGGYNRYSLTITSAHEVYPGHYTNYLFNKQSKLSLIRNLEWNVAFGEGWAHYGEQMIVDEGLGNGDPRYRLAQLDEALLRESRLVVGIKEHTQGMTVEQATRFFADNVFASHGESLMEAVRGATDPLYGHYTWGKLMIFKLRADYQKKMGSKYAIGRFHDELLSHGDPPVYFLRKLLLGVGDQGALL